MSEIELIESREANALLRRQLAALRAAVVGHIAESLIEGDCDTHRRVKALATAFDGAGVNVDQALDDRLGEEGLSYDWVSQPFGMNRSVGTWTDSARKVWDLTATWVGDRGIAWVWTGSVLDGHPLMRTEPKGLAPDAIFEAIELFCGPLTPTGGTR